MKKRRPSKRVQRPRRTPPATATTEQITEWMKSIPELEWSDFYEVTPGEWTLDDTAKPKMVRLYDLLTVRMAEIDAYAEQVERDLEEHHSRWVTPPLVK